MFMGIYILLSLIIAAGVYFNRNRVVNNCLVYLFAGLQCLLCTEQFFASGSVQMQYFTKDSVAQLLLIVLGILNITSIYYSGIYLKKRNDTPKMRSIYFSAYIILIMSISCNYLANHIAIGWIFVEVTTLSASVLIYHRKTTRSLEAAWKYVFICSVSVALIFMGILLTGLAVERARTGDLYYASLMKAAGAFDSLLLKSAFLLIYTGFTVKVGLFPMYTAGIDAKDKAPSPASAILSSSLLNVGFLGVFRLYSVISKTNSAPFANAVIIISSVCSLIIAAAYMIRVKSYKRMFAYSSIEHMGIAMLGIAMGGVGYFGAILHIVLHSFTKAAMFYQFGSVYRIIKSKFIKDAGDYFNLNLSGAIVFLLGFFMLSAIPPSGLFVSEFLIFMSMFSKGYVWLIFTAGLLLTFIIWSLGITIFRLLFQKPKDDKINHNNTEKIHFTESIPQLILLGLVFYIGYFPPAFVTNLINDAVKLFK